MSAARSRRAGVLATAIALALALPSIARAQDADGDDDDDDAKAPASQIVVTAHKLDAARAAVEPSLGASTYTLTNDTIENRPGGETRTLGTILQQAPGVWLDGQGNLIVRNAPGGVQYRINNVILPQGVAEFGDGLSARLADRTELITGALPAQYGLAAGSVVNVTTKSGLYERPGGDAELYGGTQATYEPAFEFVGASGGSSLFASGDYRHSDVGIAPVTRDHQSVHDSIEELEGFAYGDHVIGDDRRVSLILGTSNERKQVPAPFAAADPESKRRGEQRTNNHYGILSYQFGDEDLTVLAALSGLLSRNRVSPDEALALAVDGAARSLLARREGAGLQLEAAYKLGADHTLRAGVIASLDREWRDERLTTPSGSSGTNVDEARQTASGFVEDEWTIVPSLTANFGVRLDHVSGLGSPTHVGPRASLSWQNAGLTLHAGYARYFIAAPLGETAIGETDDYFDAGAEQKLGALTLGIDAYSRHSRNLLAERTWAFGPIGDTFAYARGRSEGVELLGTYAAGPVTAWANIALARSRGRGIAAGRELFDAATLAAIDSRWVATELDQRVTASGGASHRFGALLVSADVLYGSGAPRTLPGQPVDGARLPGHARVDLAAVYRLELIAHHPVDLRLDVTNLFDRRYQLGDGTTPAGGAPQWSAGRGVFVGLEQSF